MTAYPTGQQFSAIHTLVSPNGYTAVFNDPTNGDYVGALIGSDAVSGLDSPTVKASVTERSQADGALQGYNFHGLRSITLRVTFDTTSVTTRNLRTSKLRKVLNDCMTADGTLTWTPDGSISQYVKVRKNSEYREAGNVVKEGFIGLIAADPYIYSTTQHNTGVINFDTSVTAENQGDAMVLPETATFNGPGTGLSIYTRYSDATSRLYLSGLTLAGGTQVIVNFRNRTILRNDGTNLFDTTDVYPNVNWGPLLPGNNTFRFHWDSGTTGASQGIMYWRDAWL